MEVEQLVWTYCKKKKKKRQSGWKKMEVGGIQGRGQGLGLYLGHSEANGMTRTRGKGGSGIHIPPGSILCHCFCSSLHQYPLQKRVRAGCSHADPSGLYQKGEVTVLVSRPPYCCQVAGYSLPPSHLRSVSYELQGLSSGNFYLCKYYVTAGPSPGEQQIKQQSNSIPIIKKKKNNCNWALHCTGKK